jgi:hypothetical protein
MKAIFLAVIFQIILYSFSYSQGYKFQTYDSTDDYWSMSFFGGGAYRLIHSGDDVDLSTFGATGGLEAAINFPNANYSLLFDIGFSSFPFTTSETDYYPNRKFKNEEIEISFGSRFYLKNNFFVQGAIGMYVHSFRRIYKYDIIDPEFYYFLNDYSNYAAGFGFNIGGGKLFSLSKTVSLITIGKIHFSSPENKGILYFTLNAGIQIKNNNTVQKSGQKNSNISAAVYSGFANYEGFHSLEYEILPNLGIEGTYRTGVNELFINVFYNQFKHKYSSSNQPKTLTTILIGERLFIGNETTRGFFEFGGGMYAYDNNTSSRTPADNVGIITGTGLIQKLYSNLSGIIKADFNWIFNEHLNESRFLTLDGGLRWDF